MKPKISIITATHNSQDVITSCLDSLKQQTVPFEHIIVDGASTDSTLGIAREHSPDSHILSEPDNGLYDALNKGIGMATGEVVGVLHADDFYAATNVLQLVSDVFQDSSVAACYGDLLYVAEERGTREAGRGNHNNSRFTFHDSLFHVKRYWRSGKYNPRKFYWGWMPPHPTFFVRKSVYDEYGLFNLNMGTAADYELMLRFLVKHGITSKYLPEVMVCMRTGGVSNANLGNRLRANRMDREAWWINGLNPYLFTTWLKPIRKLPQYFLRP